MRLLSLDLERYGPFSGKRLTFRPDARLHLVFGRNEAGKSSSLAAVTDLLFGVRRPAPDDFLRPGKDMRLGATIVDSRGNELAFRRRKLKPLLTDGADVALPEDALGPFLGGLTRDVFRRAFGLDAEALRRSGEELRESGGELGAALFSAASGLRGINEIKLALEREADAIFAERRSQNRSFYQALDRYEAARKLLREQETRAGALKALHEELAEQRRRGDEITARRGVIVLERARLERLRRAAPILRAIDEEEARLGAIGALPVAPEGAGQALVEAVRSESAAAVARDEAAREQLRLRAEYEAIAIDAGLLEAAGEIEALQVRLGQFQKGMRDLPGVERDEDAAARQLAGIAVRLGLADAALLLRGQPEDAALAHLGDLTAEGRRLAHARESRHADARLERETLDARRLERSGRAALRDPRGLRERLQGFDEMQRLAQTAQESAATVAAETMSIAQAAARLTPAIGDIGVLAGRPLPSRAGIAAFALRFAACDDGLRRECEGLDAARKEAAGLAERRDMIAAGGPVPTAERLAAVRSERDGHWQALRRVLFGEAAMEAPSLAAAVAGFETARAQADAMADSGLGDAQRVATHAEISRNLARVEDGIRERQLRLAAAGQAAQEVRDDWQRAWEQSGIAPLAPGEMGPWLERVELLIERGERLRETAEQVAEAQRRIDRARPALATLIDELGLAAQPGLSVAADMQRARREIDRIAEIWDAARDSDTLLNDLERRVAKSQADAAAAGEAFEAWRARFEAALPRVGLAGSATIAEVEASLAARREVPVAASLAEGLKRRVVGIRRDAAGFVADVAVLAGKVAPDLAGEPEAVLRALGERLTRMREARTRREAAQRRIEEAGAALLQATQRHEAAQRAAAKLAEALALAATENWTENWIETGTRLAERDALAARLRQKRAELALVADGRDEAELRAGLSEHVPEIAEADQVKLDAEARRLEADGQEAYAAARDAAARLESLSGTVTAEVALQQRLGAESELEEAARDWAVLSVGALMIGTAIARQRRSRQEPLMLRAGAHFATLTGDAFSGLGQAFDEADVPHLVGRRSAGDEIGVAAMSEGTRDQLYLALRLAYVEDYAMRAEAPPFLADDLFSSFDDERTACGLRALAGMVGSVQPILFTHHRFVVEAARRELGESVEVLELA